MYYWNNEVEDMYGDDWTFTSGWAEGSTPYILGEVASQDAIWLLGDNLSSILYKNGESKKNKQLIGGEREKMKPLDYPVKVYNADGELVLETTESYLREHRKEIELTYNLISDKKVEQRLTDQQKQELYKHLQEINEKDLK